MNIWLAILIGLACLLGAAVLSSIKLKFRFDEKVKTAGVSYLLFGGRVDINKGLVSMYVGPIRVKRYRLSELMASIARKKETVPDTGDNEKEKAAVSDGRRQRELPLKFDLGDLWRLRNILKRIRLRYLDLRLSGGFADPYRTGQLLAGYMILRGMMPIFMSHIQYSVDFSADSLDFKGKGFVSLRILYILIEVLRLLTDKLSFKSLINFILPKKGATYGGQQSF